MLGDGDPHVQLLSVGRPLMNDLSSVVVIDRLVHRYDDRRVIDGISFSLRPGVTGLVGVNGAGKSTLLHVLATVLRPDEGEVRIAGVDLRRHAQAARRHVALAPQVFVPPEDMRVGDFLTYMAWLRGIPRRERAAELTRALAIVDLLDRRRDRFRSLSGGMVQRANIAQALLGSPELILLDEPMDGLDPEQRVRIRQLVATIGRRTCVLLSSHVMDDIVPIADRVMMLDRGRIVFDDAPDRLRELGADLVAAGSELSPYEAAFLALRDRSQAEGSGR